MAERRSSGGADFVARIVKDPANPPQTAMLTGYLGASSEKGHTRLYFDPSLSSYVEIPDDAILHTQDSGEAGGLGGSHVWVRRDAELTYGPAGTQRPKGKFLEGPIMQAHAAGAAAAVAPAITLAAACGHPTLLPPCPTPHAPCVTPVCTHLPPCHPSLPPQCHPSLPPQCHPSLPPQCHPSLPPQCHITLPVCPTETCHPSVQIACPSVHAVCPSAVDACPSVHCVSQGHICPTPSAVDACPSVHCVTQGLQCVATGFNCPSAVGCGPSLACNIPDPGVAVHPAAAGAAVHARALTAACPSPPAVCLVQATLVNCPTHRPELCVVPSRFICPTWNVLQCHHITQNVLQCTIACPVLTPGCPIQTPGCPIGPFGGGFNPVAGR